MATNLYHHLHFMPATEAWEMPPALEKLALALVQSGKLRINADVTRNFVRHDSQTFTSRELTDPALTAITRRRLARHVAPAAGEHGLNDLWAHLLSELKKARGVSAEKEAKAARVLVQSIAPSVIQLLIQSGTEIYVSYSHNVADLMAVHEWQTHGENSGLQATDDAGTAVYISAGGDPFFEGTHKTYTTDGFPALARMVVIAGQEFGHFADLRRSNRGIIGRYSTDINASQLRADPTAREARLSDMATVQKLTSFYQKNGLNILRRAEKGVTFYHKSWRYSPPWFFYQLWRLIAWSIFTTRCRRIQLPTRFKTLPKMRLGEAIEAYLSDMAFNLAPDADVYRHPDPLVEEAIAVIEAVGRVPQQLNKWGISVTYTAWPELARFYQGTILPACEATLAQPPKPNNINIFHKLKINTRRCFRTKPGYYP